jgi:predicted outer membrane lipoprotein
VNERFLAICLWGFAWIALGVPAAAAFTAIRGRGTALTAVGTAVFLFTAAVLANAGADLW